MDILVESCGYIFFATFLPKSSRTLKTQNTKAIFLPFLETMVFFSIVEKMVPKTQRIGSRPRVPLWRVDTLLGMSWIKVELTAFNMFKQKRHVIGQVMNSLFQTEGRLLVCKLYLRIQLGKQNQNQMALQTFTLTHLITVETCWLT